MDSWTVAHQALIPWNFSGKNSGVVCHSLLQVIFPIQGSNPWSPALPTAYHLSHQGSLKHIKPLPKEWRILYLPLPTSHSPEIAAATTINATIWFLSPVSLNAWFRDSGGPLQWTHKVKNIFKIILRNNLPSPLFSFKCPVEFSRGCVIPLSQWSKERSKHESLAVFL